MRKQDQYEAGPYIIRGHLIEGGRGTVAVIAKAMRQESPDRAKATARLLAAAPTLLMAAENVLRDLNARKQLTIDTLQLLKDAIAQVHGSQHVV